MSLLDLYLTTRERMSGAGATAAASTSKTADAPAATNKAEAEKLKAQGNAFMSSKNYDGAIDAYTQAIAFDGENAVYYSNRAAAYSSQGKHASAIEDAEQAIELDSSFAKAYHRLG